MRKTEKRANRCKGFAYVQNVRYQTTDFGEILCEDRQVHDIFGKLRWESDILLSRGTEQTFKPLPTGKSYHEWAEKKGQLRLFDRPYRGS